jgi:Domain of unknown function (DUF4400)
VIRATLIASLTSVLVLVLYLPSAFAPERFIAQLRDDHERVARVWGPPRALRLLDTGLNLQDTTRQATPGVMPSASSADAAFDAAVAHEMVVVRQRLFDNAYVRSIEALLLLAMFRLAVIGDVLPWLAPFIAVAVGDAQMTRLVKAREFRQHDPEVFALAMVAAIATGCGTFIALLVPVDVPVLAWPIAPLAVGWLVARALACFHTRG